MEAEKKRKAAEEERKKQAELRKQKALEARKAAEENGWFDISTFKELYRIEGKKTMGFELAEQFNPGSSGLWELPDVIIYPTGGGIGLVGISKAFDELEEL